MSLLLVANPLVPTVVLLVVLMVFTASTIVFHYGVVFGLAGDDQLILVVAGGMLVANIGILTGNRAVEVSGIIFVAA